MTNNTAGELQRARLAQKLSLNKLARRAGVSRSTVVRLENSESNPRFASLYKVAKALGLKPVFIDL